MPDANDRQPDALLCESCGYRLSGLDADEACPECGRSIESSLPHHRPGPAFHELASVRTWLAYAREALTPGSGAMRRIRIDEAAARRLLTANVRIAAGVIALAALAALAVEHLSGVGNRSAWGPTREWVLLFIVPLSLLFAAPVLRGLTWIERRGIMLFGRQHGWRVTREVAWSVCAHASVGWVLAAGLLAAGFPLGWALGRGVRAMAHMGARPPWWVIETIETSTPVLAFGAGLLVFEFLVYFGVRSSRFANRPGAR